jgi:DnaK suppressor protein
MAPISDHNYFHSKVTAAGNVFAMGEVSKMKADRNNKAGLKKTHWRQAMNRSELNEFGKTLKIRQAELSAGSHNREVLAIETSADEFDRIQSAQERDFAVGAINRESMRAREIRAALQRIESGSFGICVNCDEEIGAKRLAAVPWTALCIVCQEAADRVSTYAQQEVSHSLLNAA